MEFCDQTSKIKLFWMYKAAAGNAMLHLINNSIFGISGVFDNVAHSWPEERSFEAFVCLRTKWLTAFRILFAYFDYMGLHICDRKLLQVHDLNRISSMALFYENDVFIQTDS